MPQKAIATDDAAGGWESYVVPQGWENFTADDHAVWDLLFARQVELLGSRVVSPFLDGIDLLKLSHPGVPDVEGLNAILEPRTGWRTVAVPGLVPDDVFFAMLSERVFPVGNFIRRREQLDYLEAPDCFHDMFGHIPLLAHHDYAEIRGISASLARPRSPPTRGTRRRGSIGTASSSVSRASMASSRSSARASPRASANRTSAWRARRSSGCPSRSRRR